MHLKPTTYHLLQPTTVPGGVGPGIAGAVDVGGVGVGYPISVLSFVNHYNKT